MIKKVITITFAFTMLVTSAWANNDPKLICIVNQEKSEKKVSKDKTTYSYIGIIPTTFISLGYYKPENHKIGSIGIVGITSDFLLFDHIDIRYSFISHNNYLHSSDGEHIDFSTHDLSLGYQIHLSEDYYIEPTIGYYCLKIETFDDIYDGIYFGVSSLFILDGNDGYYSIDPFVGYHHEEYLFGISASGTVLTSEFVTIYVNMKYEYCDTINLFTLSTSIGVPLKFLD